MRDRLSERHAVTLESGCEHENVGTGVEGLETVRRDRARDENAVGEIETRDVRVETPGRVGVASKLAHDGEPPLQIEERRDRGEQYVISLARNHRADRQ